MARIWDIESGKQKAKFEGHLGLVSSVAIELDRKVIISGSYDETVR